MVDFKKLKGATAPRPSEPQALFHSLLREGDYQYLRDVQKDVLDAWYARRTERDFIIKMNTGSGKTLVGLLMLQSGLNDQIGPALYLCPTAQLVQQVVAQAKRYGIAVVEDQGGALPIDFLNKKKILVAQFQTFFNGMSRFGVVDGRHPPIPLGGLLIDDAHSCVARAREKVSLSFDSEHPLYTRLFELFRSTLEQQNRPVAAELENGTTYATLAVPHWAWVAAIGDVSTAIGKHQSEDAVKFTWPLILHDLELFQCIVSSASIDIYPFAVPIERVPSFVKATRRFFLSATLVDDSALVRDFGVESDAARTPIRPKVSADVGERLILAPSLVRNDLSRDALISLVKEYVSKGYNTLVLVPSNKHAKDWVDAGADLQAKDDAVADAISKMSSSKGQFLVLANRYDGMDLPGDACRLLVLDELPMGGLKYEQHLMSARPGSKQLFAIQAQRIEQGLGRGVRSGNDYCAVLVLGGDLTTFVGTVERQQLFSPATRRQVELGLDLVESLKTEGEPLAAIRSALNACLEQDPEWKSYHHGRMTAEPMIDAAPTDSIELAEMERAALQLFRGNQAVEASDLVQGKMGSLKSIGEGDTGWYLQFAAHLRSKVDAPRAQELQRAAHQRNSQLTKPLEGAAYRRLNARKGLQVHRIQERLQGYMRTNALSSAAESMLAGCTFGARAHVFEQAWQQLGEFLGFASQRPEWEFNVGPDNLWDLEGELYLVTEAKSEVLVERDFISKSEASQLSNSANWFKTQYLGRPFVPLLIHPTAILASDAFLPEDAKVLTPSGLSRLAGAVRQLVATLAQKPADFWTAEPIGRQLASLKLTPTSLVNAFCESPKRQ